MSKLMFKRGNLHTGNVYGVEVTGAFGSYEIHGPFSGENEAWNYGMALAKASTEWESFALVTIETPFLKPIASPEAIRAHREHVGDPATSLREAGFSDAFVDLASAPEERVPDSRPPRTYRESAYDRRERELGRWQG